MNRYEQLFEREKAVFVPFIMLGESTTLTVIRAAVRAGADAVELGVPFSDPVADGPTIQAAHLRAMMEGATIESVLDEVRAIRAEFPDLPIGMLVYANVAFSRGIEKFYQDFHEAGADSILIPDVPVRESAPFVAAADAAGICPIFIAPPNADAATVRRVAAATRGYIYAVSRDGVTGTEMESQTHGLDEVIANAGAMPVLLGFGISTPEHVRAAIAARASGAITGSALAKIVEAASDVDAAVYEYVKEMKAATSS